MVPLPGNVRSQANAANDRGLVEPGLRLDHMEILLNRPAASEAALEGYVDGLTDPRSPDYHHWLSAAEYGQPVQAVPGRRAGGHRLARIAGLHGRRRAGQPHGDRLLGHRRPGPPGVRHRHPPARRGRRAARLQHERPAGPPGAGRDRARHRVAERLPPARLSPAAAGLYLHQRRLDPARGGAGRPRHHLRFQSAVRGRHLRPGPDHRGDRGHRRLQDRGLDHVPLRA